MNIFVFGSCIGVVAGPAVVVPLAYFKFGVWGAVVGVPVGVVLATVVVALLIIMAFFIGVLFEEGPKGQRWLKGFHSFFGCMWVGAAIVLSVKQFFINPSDGAELYGITSTYLWLFFN